MLVLKPTDIRRYQLSDVTIDLTQVNVADICECWNWLIGDMSGLLVVSKMGDMFLHGKDDGIYWLAADSGELTKVANSLIEFNKLLYTWETFDNWFLPGLIETLVVGGKTLKANQVYSYLKLPVLGGEYSVHNINPTDISVHFALSGQICEQIKNLPDGTRVVVTPAD